MYSDDDDRVARTLFLSKLKLLLPILVLRGWSLQGRG